VLGDAIASLSSSKRLSVFDGPSEPDLRPPLIPEKGFISTGFYSPLLGLFPRAPELVIVSLPFLPRRLPLAYRTNKISRILKPANVSVIQPWTSRQIRGLGEGFNEWLHLRRDMIGSSVDGFFGRGDDLAAEVAGRGWDFKGPHVSI